MTPITKNPRRLGVVSTMLAAMGLGANVGNELKSDATAPAIGKKLHAIGGPYRAPSRYRGGKHRGRNAGAFGQSAGQKRSIMKLI
jgi:hypothetical protein